MYNMCSFFEQIFALIIAANISLQSQSKYLPKMYMKNKKYFTISKYLPFTGYCIYIFGGKYFYHIFGQILYFTQTKHMFAHYFFWQILLAKDI